MNKNDENIEIILGESDNFMGTFRYAIRPFLVIGQIFGVMPVIGVTNRSLSKLHFKWNSIRTCYGFIITIYVLSYTLVQFWTILTSTVKLEKIGSSALFFKL